jgi:hypothetical protein
MFFGATIALNSRGWNSFPALGGNRWAIFFTAPQVIGLKFANPQTGGLCYFFIRLLLNLAAFDAEL